MANDTPVQSDAAKATPRTETALFGAGCFWGVEATFRQVPGVISTQAGYTGGTVTNPTYKQVCTDRTGHAETVEVVYDPARVSYEQLLRIFWENHDPTTLNRQGPDVGSQYRSVIFYTSPAQRELAQASLAAQQASGQYRRPIVTAIEPASTFYPAEEYHQQYLEKRGLASCHIG
jgi:peptide-methionine (S)-S-oxide reductase